MVDPGILKNPKQLKIPNFDPKCENFSQKALKKGAFWEKPKKLGAEKDPNFQGEIFPFSFPKILNRYPTH